MPNEDDNKLFLVDRDVRRRAKTTHVLVRSGLHVEPYESNDDLASKWPNSGLIIIYDEPGYIRDLIEKMDKDKVSVPFIAYCQEPKPRQIVQAVKDGALDYLSWPIILEELSAAIINCGQTRPRSRISIDNRVRYDRLTRREQEVFEGMGRGLSSRLIGEKLAISRRTVEAYRASLLNKLGLRGTSDAVAYWHNMHIGEATNSTDWVLKRAHLWGDPTAVVLDPLTETRDDGEPAALTIDTCVELIIASAIQVRPSLSSSAVDRREMQPILDEMKITFAEQRARSN